jgi:hypothetical protein
MLQPVSALRDLCGHVLHGFPNGTEPDYGVDQNLALVADRSTRLKTGVRSRQERAMLTSAPPRMHRPREFAFDANSHP